MATIAEMQASYPHTTKPYLNLGFVTLLECMGDDEAIEAAARMSYGSGTRTISDRRNLLRYLMRHAHTSPFEMGVVRFHIKLPIFIARQFVRHRTFSLNELSARYSVLDTGFYIPEPTRYNAQSVDNKQGSQDVQMDNWPELDDAYSNLMDTCESTYDFLLESGLSRELARCALPVATYTELVFKADLKNLMHFLRLRLHPHAQMEIRELAQVIYDLLKATGRYDLTLEAFEDYHIQSVQFSRPEMDILLTAIHNNPDVVHSLISHIEDSTDLSNREKKELEEKLKC